MIFSAAQHINDFVEGRGGFAFQQALCLSAWSISKIDLWSAAAAAGLANVVCKQIFGLSRYRLGKHEMFA